MDTTNIWIILLLTHLPRLWLGAHFILLPFEIFPIYGVRLSSSYWTPTWKSCERKILSWTKLKDLAILQEEHMNFNVGLLAESLQLVNRDEHDWNMSERIHPVRAWSDLSVSCTSWLLYLYACHVILKHFSGNAYVETYLSFGLKDQEMIFKVGYFYNLAWGTWI